MAFSKFMSILDTSSLWFARADQFDDMFEGSTPRINVSARSVPSYLSKEDIPAFRNLMTNTASAKQQWIRYVAINCWQMNTSESTAMWGLYLPKGSEGIAIQSTYARLKHSLRTAEPVYIGMVKYIDYEHEVIEDDGVLAPFIHKRNVFRHEREIRALIVRSPPPGPRGPDFTIETISKGVQVSVDLSSLIEKVYVAPDAPAGLIDAVRSEVENRGSCFGVVPSSISAKPEF